MIEGNSSQEEDSHGLETVRFFFGRAAVLLAPAEPIPI
jgi:hypothetical protein